MFKSIKNKLHCIQLKSHVIQIQLFLCKFCLYSLQIWS